MAHDKHVLRSKNLPNYELGLYMIIASIKSIPLRIPFQTGGKVWKMSGQPWNFLDFVLVRVEMEDGTVGWGDAFAYQCRASVHAAIEQMVAPVAIGCDHSNITPLMLEMQKKLHLFGRYGITMFAVSGLDIVLWDAAAKSGNMPLCRL